ncbi:MAG: hypothetical protein WCL06_14810 [Bacteroidota bacterium]
MTTKELKSEIQKLLDTVPENVLQDLLDYLKQANHQTKDQSELSSYLKKILAEDKQVLEKLAK